MGTGRNVGFTQTQCSIIDMSSVIIYQRSIMCLKQICSEHIARISLQGPPITMDLKSCEVYLPSIQKHSNQESFVVNMC